MLGRLYTILSLVVFFPFPIHLNSIVLLQPSYNLVCSVLNCIFDTLHSIEAGVMFKKLALLYARNWINKCYTLHIYPAMQIVSSYNLRLTVEQ